MAERCGSTGLSTTAYSYVTTAQQYRSTVGCYGPLEEIIWLWDQAHDSVRNPRWTLYRLRIHILEQKRPWGLPVSLTTPSAC